MEDQELYDISSQTGLLVKQARALVGTQLYRYHAFVDGSDRGSNCTYARITSREFHTQEGPEPARQILLNMRKQIDRVLEDIPTEVSPPSWLEEL